MNDLVRDDVAALERIEVEACRSWTAAAPAAVARDLGIAARPLGTGLAVRASRVDLLAYNRVVGLGIGARATAGELDDAIASFRRAGVPRIVVNLAPVAAREVRGWLEARGFRVQDHSIRLWRGVGPSAGEPPDPRVRPMGREHAEVFARADTEAFGHPAAMIPWIAATVGRPAWRHWAAFDGAEPVGFGALFVKDDLGWLGFASTRLAHRRRGIQAALIAARTRAAADLGCRLLSVETAAEGSGKPGGSARNLVRKGFRIGYRRPNWVLELA